MSLKQKTISGLQWSFIDNFVNYGIQFVFGLVMARLLDPKDWGLIGMLTFFIAISQSCIDSGFGQALIRKAHCTDSDYSTVFFFNLTVGALLYFLLFFLAGPISRFYREPQLFLLVRIVGLVLLINAATFIQGTMLNKSINFKLLTKISVIASLSSGVFGVFLAYKGFGVWSLAVKTITHCMVSSVLLWTWNRWTPILAFSKESFREMYGFGYKLFISGLIETTYRNVYYLVIGKFFSAAKLGYYTRAEQFCKFPSSNITTVIQRVSYPVLSSVQGDALKLKKGYQKLIKSTMFITFVLMIGMAAVARPMITVLIGAKWLPSLPYLQLLCFAAMLYPLHALNLNILKVKGRSDLFLKLEIIKKIFALPVIAIGIFIGIKTMIAGMIVSSILAFSLNSYYSAELIDYPAREQVMDIMPGFAIAGVMGIIVFLAGLMLPFRPAIVLLLQLLTGAALVPLIAGIFKLDAYLEIKEIVLDKLKKTFGRKAKIENA